MGFVFIGYMIRTEIRARRDDDEDDEKPADTTGPIARRRRDHDADAEDALVDALGR